jgi:hypothetical protein
MQYTGSYSDLNVRDIILKNLSIVSRNQIKWSDIINPENLKKFIIEKKKK